MSISDKLTIAAEKIPLVYEAGQKSKYDQFWDAYQQNGNRTNYTCAFAGEGWTINIFKPKYNIAPTIASYLFYQNETLTDIPKFCQENHITIDFSNCSNTTNLFDNCKNLVHAGTIDVSKSIGILYRLFTSCSSMKTLSLIIGKNSNNIFQYCFNNCSALTEFSINGGNIVNDFDIHWSPLTKESITSVVNALSADVTGKTASFSLNAKETAFSDEEWNTLIAAKSNWTISLL